MQRQLHLLVTLSPTMPHFKRFARDKRLSGIRVNSAMIYANEMDAELKAAAAVPNAVPLYFDLKGRQLRIKQVYHVDKHLELELNHRISVKCPTPVLFKGGEDHALLLEVKDQGPDQPQRLVFHGGPEFNLKPGESICIRHPSFAVLDQTFPAYEVERIKKVAACGWTRYVLSYVESQRDIDEFRQYVGNDVEVVAKIESRKGLEWVANGYKPQNNLRLLTARGDLYLEVNRPHEMLAAQRLIVEKDPQAIVGSRILLSCCRRSIPDAVDFSELAWLFDIGYRTMMLCDDLCIDEAMLSRAINAFDAFREDYANVRLASGATSGSPTAPELPPVPPADPNTSLRKD
jgi:pyruvate kinase